jgi:glycerol uptake facilitator protein
LPTKTIRRILPTRTPFVRTRASLPGETLAEFFGTFVLIALGLGVNAVAAVGLPGSDRQQYPFGPDNWLIIVFGWFFAVAFAIYVAGGVSGAHLNPAVTLAFALRRKFDWKKVIPYALAQTVGTFCGAALVYVVYGAAIDNYNSAYHLARPDSMNTYGIFATSPAPYFHGGLVGPFVDQIVGTAILLVLIAALIDHRNQAPAANMGPLLMGMVIALIGCAYGTNAGYALNPARDFGARLFAYMFGWGKLALPGDYGSTSQYWWVPIVGPLVGATVGILLYDLFIGHVLAAREAMLKPPEPGLTPEPTTEAAAAVAGPVAVEVDGQASPQGAASDPAQAGRPLAGDQAVMAGHGDHSP